MKRFSWNWNLPSTSYIKKRIWTACISYIHTEIPISPRGQAVYIEKSVFFYLFCFVLFCFFFLGGGGGEVKEMWSVILGCTNLCSFGQISNRYKCSSTRTERKVKILALLTKKKLLWLIDLLIDNWSVQINKRGRKCQTDSIATCFERNLC